MEDGTKKQKYFVVMFEDKALVSFDTKSELDAWLNNNRVTVGVGGALHTDDSKEISILKGHELSLHTTVRSAG